MPDCQTRGEKAKIGEGRTRTADTGIFSPLLCQLSYLAGKEMAGATRLELATSCVTGRHPRPLDHAPAAYESVQNRGKRIIAEKMLFFQWNLHDFARLHRGCDPGGVPANQIFTRLSGLGSSAGTVAIDAPTWIIRSRKLFAACCTSRSRLVSFCRLPNSADSSP